MVKELSIYSQLFNLNEKEKCALHVADHLVVSHLFFLLMFSFLISLPVFLIQWLHEPTQTVKWKKKNRSFLYNCSGAFWDQDGGYASVHVCRVVCARYRHLSGKTSTCLSFPDYSKCSTEKRVKNKTKLNEKCRWFPRLCSDVVVRPFLTFSSFFFHFPFRRNARLCLITDSSAVFLYKRPVSSLEKS